MTDPAEHVRLVKVVAWSMRSLCRPNGALELGDLEGFGYLGLVAACDRYRPESGASFPTYARYRIRGAILDGVRKYIPGQRHAEPPTLVQWGKLSREPEADGLLPADEAEQRELVAQALDALPYRVRHVVEQHYLEDVSQPDIAASLGVSKARVSQIISQGVRSMRYATQHAGA